MRTLISAAVAGTFLASGASAAPTGMTFLAHEKVADYAKWRAFYDAGEARRTGVGLTDCAVQQTLTDPNEFVITCAMADAERAKASAEDKTFAAELAKVGLLRRDIMYLGAPR